MKILLVLIMVLWAGTGWAEHIYNDGCNTCVQTGPSSYSCTAMACVSERELAEWQRKMDVHKNESCLERMEAAMRAMDEYIVFGLGPRYQNERSDKADRVGQQWNAVKQECWRNP